MSFATRLGWTLGAIGLLASACGPAADRLTASDLEPAPFSTAQRQLTSNQEAEARALEIVEGTVIETKKDVERGLEIFKVHIKTASGAIVEIKLSVETGQVVEIDSEGETGSTFDPQDGFLSLAKATAIATELHAGELVSWELELDDTLAWKYELIIRAADGTLFEVELDAKTGEVHEHGLESEVEQDTWDDHGVDTTPDDNGVDTTPDDNGVDGTADDNGVDGTADDNGVDGTADDNGAGGAADDRGQRHGGN